MTVIAAVATPTHVVMGSDIMSDYGGTVIHKAASKVFPITAGNGERVLFGVAGNASLGPVIRRHLTIDSTPEASDNDGADEWAGSIAEAIANICDSTTPRLTTSCPDGADSLDGVALMAWRQHLWYVFTHTAFRPNGNVAAVGSGDEAARASMHTALSHGIDPDTAVADAIYWASEINTGCRLDERGPLIHHT